MIRFKSFRIRYSRRSLPKLAERDIIKVVKMEFEVLLGIMIPFIGTAIGAGAVFFLKRSGGVLFSALGGFAGGVMIAASVWSLLIPAMEWSAGAGVDSPLPAVLGFLVGVAVFIFLDWLVRCFGGASRDGNDSSAKSNIMLTLAVTVHNLPEGVAVGIVYAWLSSGIGGISSVAALTLAVGVGIQNIPEGAIISLPYRAVGVGRVRAFRRGIMSAVVELIGAVLAIVFTSALLPILPYLLGFAAGAMIYVVVKELVPQACRCAYENLGTVSFAAGFALMMTLDVLLG